MTSVAAVCCGLVFWEREGRTYAGISGPVTRTGTAPVPAGATFLGIEFAVGTSLRAMPNSALVDGGVELPDATRTTFRLDGVRWETPGPDDAEALVGRLVRSGAAVRDPLVTEVRKGHRAAVSGRTVERRFRAATGLTPGRRTADRTRTQGLGAPRRRRPSRRCRLWTGVLRRAAPGPCAAPVRRAYGTTTSRGHRWCNRPGFGSADDVVDQLYDAVRVGRALPEAQYLLGLVRLAE
jgi:hypothetical protein